MYKCVYVCVCTRTTTSKVYTRGWCRVIGCLKLQVIYRKRATNYEALLREMTYKDKASYDSTPPFICRVQISVCACKGSNVFACVCAIHMYVYICVYIQDYTYICVYMCVCMYMCARTKPWNILISEKFMTCVRISRSYNGRWLNSFLNTLGEKYIEKNLVNIQILKRASGKSSKQSWTSLNLIFRVRKSVCANVCACVCVRYVCVHMHTYKHVHVCLCACVCLQELWGGFE